MIRRFETAELIGLAAPEHIWQLPPYGMSISSKAVSEIQNSSTGWNLRPNFLGEKRFGYCTLLTASDV